MTTQLTAPTTDIISSPVGLPDPAILAGQLAPSSINTYRRDMAAYVAWCENANLSVVDPASLVRWLTHMAADTTLSPNTINRRLSAVKRVSKEAAAQGYLSADIAIGFERVAGVKARALKGRQRAGFRTRVAPIDMRRLCDAPDATTLKGQRDRALLATLASSGVRISELAGLKVADIVSRDGGYLLRVLGKTDIEPREAPLSPEAYGLISAWLSARTVSSEYVFTAFAGRGSTRAVARPLTRVAAWQTVQHYADECKLAHIKPHDFRRFVGTQLAAKDIRQAQKALGHKRIDTTARHYVLDELAVGLTDNLY